MIFVQVVQFYLRGTMFIVDCIWSMKSLEIDKEGMFRRYVPLESYPWDVEAVGNSQVVVSLPNRKCITVIDLNTEE